MIAIAEILESALQYHRLGNLDKAECAYKKLLRRAPKHAEGLHGLGLIEHQRGNHRRAITLIRSAIEKRPESPLFYINLAIVLVVEGASAQAEQSLLTAASKFKNTPRYKTELAEIHLHLSDLYLAGDRLESAFKHLKQAAHFQPGCPENYKRLGCIQIQRGELDSAINYLKEAIRICPDFGEAYNMLGRVFHDSGDAKKAREYYQQAIQVQPELPESYGNMGNLLIEIGILRPAIECLRRALQLKPNYSECYVNLGISMLDQQNFKAAAEYFEHACQLKPDNANLHGYWSHALLSRGLFAEGWEESESGLRLGTRIVTNVSIPFWEGEPLADRTVLVLSEQGVGDQIMFLSCVPDFLDKASPATCILECDQRLIPLYRRSFPNVHFEAKQHASHWLANRPAADVKVAIGSLPRMLRSSIDDFPSRAGYLVPDSERVMCWKKRYQSLGGDRVIGISWRGGCSAQAQRQRSTSLAQWVPVLCTPATTFVNLQYGDCIQELKTTNSGQQVLLHDWPDADPLADLDNLAAQIAALDLVISIDNCTVHMAGAIGIPVWTLLPFVSDWRWMRYREDTPWYPTMKLLRQPNPGDWASVFNRVAQMLSTDSL